MAGRLEGDDCWLALARAPGLHADHLRPYPALLADPAALIGEPVSTLEKLGMPPAAAHWLAAPQRALLDQDHAWIARASVQLLRHGAPGYPPLLTEIASAPLLLFARGEARRLSRPQLAVVGTRRPTAIGRHNATEFAARLAAGGLIITSGLAIGVDRAAHEGALRAAGGTVAVLGTGLDLTYPREHQLLAEQIVAASGVLVSEFPRGTAPHKLNFPRRNRLISGLSLGTLVIEAARRSGSLITARFAGEQGRETFAIPGSIHNPMAHGCHRLIQQGAMLVEDPREVLAELKFPVDIQELTEPGAARFGGLQLDNQEKILLDALGFEPASVDLLVNRTGFGCQLLSALLLELELRGLVAAQTGGRYVRLPQGR